MGRKGPQHAWHRPPKAWALSNGGARQEEADPGRNPRRNSWPATNGDWQEGPCGTDREVRPHVVATSEPHRKKEIPPVQGRPLLRRDTHRKKRPERPASVPDRCIDGQRPGRGADPRFPLGPPLMLSPVALPGTAALDGILGPVPLADPSGRGEHTARLRGAQSSYPRLARRSSTKRGEFSTGREHAPTRPSDASGGRGPRRGGKANPETPAWADRSPHDSFSG